MARLASMTCVAWLAGLIAYEGFPPVDSESIHWVGMDCSWSLVRNRSDGRRSLLQSNTRRSSQDS